MIVKTKHGRFAVDPRDVFIGQRIARTGEYGEEEIELLGTCIGPQSNVLIVGAHVGVLAVPLSQRCRSLVAVEANPDTYKLLVQNVALNERRNITTIFGAANDTAGELDFLCGTHNSGGSKRAPIVHNPDYFYDNPTTARVPAFRLDDRLSGPFDLVHMDIEGSEVFAMRGARSLLSQVKYLSVEFISHHLTDVAGVTVDEWLEPIPSHFDTMLVPGSTQNKRPHIFLERADWHEMLQNIVNAGVGVEEVIFFEAP